VPGTAQVPSDIKKVSSKLTKKKKRNKSGNEAKINRPRRGEERDGEGKNREYSVPATAQGGSPKHPAKRSVGEGSKTCSSRRKTKGDPRLKLGAITGSSMRGELNHCMPYF